ncbi:unnamed protein product [Meloidogyne enterolobii]|uniref:Uncharacterized protein n=1 Tax=Meloidogyne enterolobii TaxID=390850 RepID=A0ACB0XUT8_MELEN
MIIIRCWMEHLINCAFERAAFFRVVFNPEMINLLFDNDKAIPLQFNIQDPYLITDNNTIFEHFWKFAFHHSIIPESLSFCFNQSNFSEQHINILFNFLINESNKLTEVYFSFYGPPRLYELIVEYVATSRDCSKMVDFIKFNYYNATGLPLSERARIVEIEQLGDRKLTKYQIVNIYNQKKIFYFCSVKGKNGLSIMLSSRNVEKWSY